MITYEFVETLAFFLSSMKMEVQWVDLVYMEKLSNFVEFSKMRWLST